MARKAKRRRKTKQKGRETNWYVIGGVVGIGIVGLFALLYVTVFGESDANSGSQGLSLLANYCASSPENCIAKGNSDAEVTVVEVSDYGCGHCANFNFEKAATLDELYVESNQVSWVVMPYALRNQSGEYPTMPSAVSAMCANEQGRFFDYHGAVFGLQGSPLFNSKEGFVQTAASLGMDVTEFSNCLGSNDYTNIVLRNIDMAQRAGVRSTPTFFINGRLVSGNLPSIADYQQLIDRELELLD